ncbi:MAG: hypothetical protein Q8L48_43220 [Archangium sp.]|nr:hypothetical protein [Archangium sp.]
MDRADYLLLRLFEAVGAATSLKVPRTTVGPRLERIGARLTDEARDLWLLTLPELRSNSRVRAFMVHVFDAFKPHQAALDGMLPGRQRPRGSARAG